MPHRNKSIRVLVVDDSALIRQMVSDFIEQSDDLELAGAARDGQEALHKIEQLKPDVVTLDVQMPRMDGLQTLGHILQRHPLPVIMLSSLTHRSANVTLQALDLGAMDYVAKPEGTASIESCIRDTLLHKIRTAAGADVKRILRIRKERAKRAPAQPLPTARATSTVAPSAFESACIALGISTGGPPALSTVFESLQLPLPPIVIVQHMPAQFTAAFAQRLDSLSAVSIKEAATGDQLKPNCAYIAPGGRHLHLQRRGSRTYVHIRDGELVSGHRPSVDVMMRCASEIYRDRCLGIIMTGMGSDGAAGCAQIQAAGGFVLGQDEETSDVYGMNKVAFVNGNVNRQFSLEKLPELIKIHCRKFGGAELTQPSLVAY